MEPARPRRGTSRSPDRTALGHRGATPPENPPLLAIRWSLLRVAIVAFGGFIVFVLASLLLRAALGTSARDPAGISGQVVFALALVADGLLALVVLVLARRLLGARPAELGLVRPTRRQLAFAAAATLALFAAAFTARIVEIGILGRGTQRIATILTGHRGPEVAFDLAAAGVIAPFAEELLFRGLLFAALWQRLPWIVAASLSAAAFALVHEPAVWLAVFTLGLGLAAVYARTRTLWAPILTHGLFNGLPLALIALGR